MADFYVRRQETAGYVILIVAPSGKQARGSDCARCLLEASLWCPLGIAHEVPEYRLVVSRGTASATE
ncbi:protein of unknown function [Candidatus Methylomirabilis oxygeniifera]|uniref:Uncharacterized protein n=1 Tax=Methylomirabilis oxygeniifera TaxID=671143 RepID=D5MKM9_METO1|nr:protein of unknown function [Candidatus Methylomirabilis oxyfera]